jgi:cysteine synthase
MKASGQSGSLLSLICDAGERYLPTYHNEDWVSECMGDCAAAAQRLNTLLA